MKCIKKYLASTLAAAILATGAVSAAPAHGVQVQIDRVQANVPAYINKDGRTMVDTTIASALGMTVQVEGDQIRFTRNGATKIMTLGSNQLGNLVMDTSAVEQDGNVYVPVSFLSQAFGLDVKWNGVSRTASISTQQRTPINVSGVPAPSYDYTQADQLAMTGYFEKDLSVELPDGSAVQRTVKFYISENAGIRPYFTLIAVPGGVDTTQFLEESGWFQIADENDECLLIMEPGTSGQWGSFQEEYAYINAAINFYKSPNSDTAALDTEKATGYFSSFGMNYFVGYGQGAPALEAWAANNPGFMISQVYVDSTGVEQSVFDEAAKKYFDGDEANNNVALNIEESEWIYYDQLPIPTWFINCTGKASIDYWKHSSDCVAQAVSDPVLGEVFVQSEDTDAWQTELFGPISKVAVLEDTNFNTTANTQAIYDFLTAYTRYDNTCAFASQLAPRVRAAVLREQGLLRSGEVTVEGELRKYLIYTPANCTEKYPNGAPVVFVWAGNTQSASLFMDATTWRNLADKEGFICVYPSEQYNASSSVTVSHKNTVQFNTALREVLRNSDLKIDWTRIYCTGQSAGSSATNTIASAYPEYYAAYASTSGPATITDAVSAGTSGIPVQEESALANAAVPNYLLVAKGDMPTRTGSLFDNDFNQLDAWAEYFLNVNQGGSVEQYDSMETSGLYNRYTTYTWNNRQDIPMTKMTMDAYRNHNCTSFDMALMWEYLSHFRAEWNESSGEVTRWYSPSSFAADDAVKINE